MELQVDESFYHPTALMTSTLQFLSCCNGEIHVRSIFRYLIFAPQNSALALPELTTFDGWTLSFANAPMSCYYPGRLTGRKFLSAMRPMIREMCSAAPLDTESRLEVPYEPGT